MRIKEIRWDPPDNDWNQARWYHTVRWERVLIVVAIALPFSLFLLFNNLTN